GARATVRAPTGGFVREVRAREGAQVQKGEILAILDSPDLGAERARIAAEREIARRRSAMARSEHDAPGEARYADEARRSGARLDYLLGKEANLELAAPMEGVIA